MLESIGHKNWDQIGRTNDICRSENIIHITFHSEAFDYGNNPSLVIDFRLN